jgi:biopolymer transport protein ExbD
MSSLAAIKNKPAATSAPAQKNTAEMRRRRRDQPAVEMQMGPMIDMVFLLLVFFMVTAKPVKPEADVSLGLPGVAEQDSPVELPDEQRILIRTNGEIVLNEQTLAAARDIQLAKFTETLARLVQSAAAAKSELLVTLAPEDEAKHQRLVDVLNACALAGATHVTFDQPAEAE